MFHKERRIYVEDDRHLIPYSNEDKKIKLHWWKKCPCRQTVNKNIQAHNNLLNKTRIEAILRLK